MRTALLLLALGGLLLAAPAAQAQLADYHVVLDMAPFEGALAPSASVTIHGLLKIVGDPTLVLPGSGIPVTYTVSALPSWATATVSPPQDVIHMNFGGTTTSGYGDFKLDVILAGDAPAGVVDYVEVTATTRPTFLNSPQKTVSIQMPIQVAAAEETCDEDHLIIDARAAPESEEPAAPSSEEDLTVQSNGATAVRGLPWYVAGGFALAGAGVGLLLRRRIQN